MGISPHVAKVIANEHAWRPISGDVVLLGRQTMFFTPDDAIAMLRESGIPVTPPRSFGVDTQTRQANSSYIRDDEFFSLLGIPRIKALDVSDYEGADIVHDLTLPIPRELEGFADFILDGSTLDNVFDPAAVLRNIARLLKPGGRLVSVNVGSNHYGPYTIPTPFWLLDYFIVNAFVDCKVYILVHGEEGVNCFTPDLSRLVNELPQTDNFKSPYVMALVVMAEKGKSSTWDKTPIQHQYRSDWDSFARCLATIKGSKRPELGRSTVGRFVSSEGYLFVDQYGKKESSAGPPGPSEMPETPQRPSLASRIKSTLTRQFPHTLKKPTAVSESSIPLTQSVATEGDASGKQPDAAKAGIFIVTLPKSGSVFIQKSIELTTGLKPMLPSQAYFPTDNLNVDGLIEFAKGGYVAQTHCDASELNLRILDHFGVTWILHLRDPRASLLSWIHHVDRPDIGMDPRGHLRIIPALPKGYSQLPFEAKVDWQIENWFPGMIRWIENWHAVLDRPSYRKRIILTSYEEMHGRDEDFVRDLIARFFDNPPKKITLPARELLVSHFRSGQLEEWRTAFTRSQIDRINALIHPELRARFGWTS